MKKKEKQNQFESEPIRYLRVDNKYIVFNEDVVTLKNQFEFSEMSDDLKTERFLRKTTPSFLRIQNKDYHVFDCYHDQIQFDQLINRFGNIDSNNLDKLISRIREIDNLNNCDNQLKLADEFADDDFLKCLKSEAAKNRIQLNENRLLSKYHLKRIGKLSKFLSLKNQIEIMFDVLGYTKREIMKQLKISKRFLNYSIDMTIFPQKIFTIKQEHSLAHEQAFSNNNKFLKFFRTNQYKYKTRRHLFDKFKELNPEIKVNSISDFERKFICRNRISYQKCKLIHTDRNQLHKQDCRVLFIKHLLDLIEHQNEVYFFDETTFEVKSNSYHLYGFKGERP